MLLFIDNRKRTVCRGAEQLNQNFCVSVPWQISYREALWRTREDVFGVADEVGCEEHI